MVLDGERTDVEGRRNVDVGLSLDQPVEDLLFAGAELQPVATPIGALGRRRNGQRGDSCVLTA